MRNSGIELEVASEVTSDKVTNLLKYDRQYLSSGIDQNTLILDSYILLGVKWNGHLLLLGCHLGG